MQGETILVDCITRPHTEDVKGNLICVYVYTGCLRNTSMYTFGITFSNQIFL